MFVCVHVCLFVCMRICLCVLQLQLFHEEEVLLPCCPALNILSAQYMWYFLGWPSTACTSPYTRTHADTTERKGRAQYVANFCYSIVH